MDPAAIEDWRAKAQKRWAAAERTKAIRSVPLPEGWTKAGTCRWCLETITGPYAKQRHWHPACKTEWLLHCDLDTQFRFLVKRDGGHCAECKGESARWHRGSVIRITSDQTWGFGHSFDEHREQFWPRPKGAWASLSPEEWATGEHQLIVRVHALEVDHRVPLWSVAHLPPDARRPYFGPRNLWLLCKGCHAAKTRKEAARRARLRKAGWPESVLHGNRTD